MRAAPLPHLRLERDDGATALVGWQDGHLGQVRSEGVPQGAPNLQGTIFSADLVSVLLIFEHAVKVR